MSIVNINLYIQAVHLFLYILVPVQRKKLKKISKKVFFIIFIIVWQRFKLSISIR